MIRLQLFFWAFVFSTTVQAVQVGAATYYLEKAREYSKGQSDSTFKYAQLALKATDGQGAFFENGWAHMYLGEVFTRYGVYGTAITHFQSAVDQFMQSGHMEEVASVHNQLGHTYYLSLSMPYVLQQHQAALRIYTDLQLPSGAATSLGYIGHYFEKLGALDSSLKYQNKALGIFLLIGDSLGIVGIYQNLGSIYEDQERFEQASSFFEKAYQYYRRNGYKNEQLGLLNNMGDIQRKTGNLQEGLRLTQKAYDLGHLLANTVETNSALKDLSKTYILLGDFEKAYTYLKESHEMVETIFSERNAKQTSGLRALYEVNQKESQIELLKRDQDLERTYRNALILGIVVLLAVTLLVLRIQRLKRKQENKLHKANHQLTSAELDRAKLSEQKLAIELENKALKEQRLENELDLKNQSLGSYALQIVQKNKVLKDLQVSLKRIGARKHGDTTKQIMALSKEIDQGLKQDKDWDDFKLFFEKVHPQFYSKLSAKVPDLSPAELRLSTLLKLNMSTKDIAAILKVAPDSIRIARYRLRKKLPIQEEDSLVSFMMEL